MSAEEPLFRVVRGTPTAEEVAASIVNLCHPLSRSINGACVTIDGGTSA